MGRHTYKPWDRRSWAVTTADRAPFTVETIEGATWALRALISAGAEGLRPTDGASSRFGMLISKLRGLGLEIEDLRPEDEAGRPGFRLTCVVEAAGAP